MGKDPGPPDRAPLDPEQWIEAYGDYLYHYAYLRLRDAKLAEDAVQETFLAALKARRSFAGHSTERTWMVGILKHKIVDIIRREQRRAQDRAPDAEANFTEQFFDRRGAWQFGPQKWEVDPDEVMVSRDFQRVLSQCLERLSARLAQAFILRELDGYSTEEICKMMEITPTNLWVMLHRARFKLRHCLESRWFRGGNTR